MSASGMSPEDLIALFAARATAPPPAAIQLFASHLQCKESLALSRIVSQAADRYTGAQSPPLPAPSSLLPPLG